MPEQEVHCLTQQPMGVDECYSTVAAAVAGPSLSSSSAAVGVGLGTVRTAAVAVLKGGAATAAVGVAAASDAPAAQSAGSGEDDFAGSIRVQYRQSPPQWWSHCRTCRTCQFGPAPPSRRREDPPLLAHAPQRMPPAPNR